MTATLLDPRVRESAREALAPVREALLARAREDAERACADAESEVAARVDAARTEVAALVAEARAQGELDTRALVELERARARRAARALVLGARRQAYEELRAACREATAALLAGPSYPAVRERLVAEAQDALGPDAVIEEAPEGGVLARVPGRRVDLSCAALAERALASLGTDVEQLWAP